MPVFEWKLPITEPVTVFALLLFIFLLVPIFLKPIRLPSITGLILAGVLVGPNGFGILERSNSIVLFGTVGLLYIAFIAGLEVDLIDFKKNRIKSIVFGIVSFNIPWILGMVVVKAILNFDWPSTILLASTFGSHTLLTYPIASRLGITKKESVNITIGGSILTDFFALLVLAVISRATKGELNLLFWGNLIVTLSLFLTIVLIVFPKIIVWFFKNLEAEGTSQFIFVLAVVFTSAFLAKQAGLEPILGSFLAGLTLNRFIMHTSTLMNRIDFVGKALFIPFFLVGVGMLVNPKVFFLGTDVILIAGVMVLCVLIGKFLAAWIVSLIFRYDFQETLVIYSLSLSQAAATLAAILVGYNIGLLNEDVLNATIIMILITCIISSIVMEYSGRNIAIRYRDIVTSPEKVSRRILVPVANPDTIESLIDLAIVLNSSDRSKSGYNPVYPLVVVRDEDDAEERIRKSHELLQKAVIHANASENSVQILTRIDWNIAHGIVRAAKENLITHILMGWNAKITTKERLFGSVLDNVLEGSDTSILVTKIQSPLNTIQNILLVAPENVEIESGFPKCMQVVKDIAQSIGASLDIYAHSGSTKALQSIFPEKGKIPTKYYPLPSWSKFSSFAWRLNPTKLFVIISARKGSVSYNFTMDSIPHAIANHFPKSNFIIIYPER